MIRSLLVAIAIAAASSAVAAPPPEVRSAVAMPPATLRELARAPRPSLINQTRHEEREREAPPRLLTAFGGAETIATNAATPSFAPPAATNGFRATKDLGTLPSDAHGAVGTQQILSVSNSEYTVHDRGGHLLVSLRPEQFWHDTGPSNGFTYDARAAYDARTGRWIVVAVYDVALTQGQMLLAVSQTSDATGVWARYRISVDAARPELTADFPRLAITRDSIVVSAQIYIGDLTAGSRVWIVSSAAAYAAPASLPLRQYDVASSFDEVPVTSDDAVTYVLTPFDDAIVMSRYGALGVESQTTLHAPALDEGSPVRASQLGSSLKIDCGYREVHYAVLRNGVLWIVEQVVVASPNRAAVRWWKYRLASQSVEAGLIDDPSGATFYAFPSIAVNAAGAALIGYSALSATQYPSAAYTYMDAAGRVSTPGLLKAGDGPYGNSRWADYSQTVVDPINDIDFWTVQTYSEVFSGSNTRWATWWGEVAVSGPPRRRVARR
jgi:hypothetical protein